METRPTTVPPTYTSRRTAFPPSMETIPAELRKVVFEICFIDSEDSRVSLPCGGPKNIVSSHHSILLTCKLFYNEGLGLYYPKITMITDFPSMKSCSLCVSPVGQKRIQRIRYEGSWPPGAFGPTYGRVLRILCIVHELQLLTYLT